MNKKYDLAVYIGRFQPFHNGHNAVIKEAFSIANKVLVLVGSTNTSINIKNPFTFEERRNMIINSTTLPVEVMPLDDYIYEENQWLTDVQELVGDNTNVCIIGHSKDESSYYLKHFPQWDFVDVEYHETIDATMIRELLYNGKLSFIKGAIPGAVYNYLVEFTKTDKYLDLTEEYKFIKEYKASWAGSPHEPTFNTVDAVVIQSGHILLIKRKDYPGKGLLALPGGFLNPKETLLDAVIRELREETKIKIPEPVLRGSIVKEETFDAVDRSTRGRTITKAFLIQLDDSQPLPKVKGSDDASHAEFIPLAKFYDIPEQMYEDHYHIIRKLLDNM